MRHTIRNETELPAPIDAGRSWDYIRSTYAPTVLIAGKDGECFERRDGYEWEHEAYRVLTKDGGKVEVEPKTTYCGGGSKKPAKKVA